MPFGLFLDPFLRVDKEQCGLGSRGPRDHIFEKFLMSGGVDDDVLAVLPMKERAGRVDRDALLLFFEEGVKQKGIFKLFALPPANFPHLLELSFRESARICEEAPQQGGLAMVHVPDDDNTEILGRLGDVSDHVISTCWQPLAATCSRLCVIAPSRGPHLERGRSVPRRWCDGAPQ